MGGSRGQRWFHLSRHQNHRDRSSAGVWAEYKNRSDLMSVAPFQKCVPVCLCEPWKLSDFGGEVVSPPHSQFVSWVKSFTDQAVWSGSVGAVVCSRVQWAALAYWPRQLRRQLKRMPQNFRSVHVRKKKYGRFSCRNKNMSTLIHVKKKKKDCILVHDECVRQPVWIYVCVCVGSCLNCSLHWYIDTAFILRCTTSLVLKISSHDGRTNVSITSFMRYKTCKSCILPSDFPCVKQWSNRRVF